ncbi:MAG: hypothetical protein COA92_07235 [Sulfurovum sp.]|nr:MAG: hypothetical protein COA92_07235 [Sulfurovum sp.]
MTIFILSNLILSFFVFYWVKSSYFSGASTFEVYLKIGVVTVLTNLIGSLVFGVTLALQVAFGTGDTAWWFMPLIIAPIEYWLLFGLPILGYYLVLTISTWYLVHHK